jgi:hypothetical protein
MCFMRATVAVLLVNLIYLVEVIMVSKRKSQMCMCGSKVELFPITVRLRSICVCLSFEKTCN